MSVKITKQGLRMDTAGIPRGERKRLAKALFAKLTGKTGDLTTSGNDWKVEKDEEVMTFKDFGGTLVAEGDFEHDKDYFIGAALPLLMQYGPSIVEGVKGMFKKGKSSRKSEPREESIGESTEMTPVEKAQVAQSSAPEAAGMGREQLMNFIAFLGKMLGKDQEDINSVCDGIMAYDEEEICAAIQHLRGALRG